MEFISMTRLCTFFLTVITVMAFCVPLSALDIPQLAKAPVIDGNIDAAEWADAAKIRKLHLFAPERIVAWGADPRDNQIFVGFDHDFFYIGMKLAKTSAAHPETASWNDDAVDIMLDAYQTYDHTWKYVQMVIAEGKIIYERFWQPWSSGGGAWARNAKVAANSANKDYYEYEVAIAVKDFFPDGLKAGQKINFNIARTWSGDVRRNWPNYSITSSLSEKYTRNCVFNLLYPAKLVEKSGDKNLVSVASDAGKKALPHIKNRQLHFFLNARTLPTYDTLWIDEISLARPSDLKALQEIELFILDAAGKKRPLAKLPAAAKYTNQHFNIAELKEGDYKLIVNWMGKNGKILGNEDFAFSIKNYPFKNTKIGLTKMILPPYTPLKLTGSSSLDTVTVNYQYNGMALPEKIIVRQSEPTVGGEFENVLSAPVQLIVKVNGKELSINPKALPQVKKQSGEEITLCGSVKNSKMQIAVDNRIEYDGLNNITLSIASVSGKVTVDTLALRIPLSEKQATLLHVIGDRNRIATAKSMPSGNGRIWSSMELKNSNLPGNFKPMIWVGNEDRGLTWYADSDENWSVDYSRPAQEIIRENGNLYLQINFINRPTVITAKRDIKFGILATPPKPLPENWKAFEITSAVKGSNYYKDWKFSPAMPNLDRIELISTRSPLVDAVYSRCPLNWQDAKAFVSKVNKHINGTVMRYWCHDISGGPIAEYYRGEWAHGAKGVFAMPGHDEKHYGDAAANPLNYTYWFINWRAKSYHDYCAWALDQFLKNLGEHSYYEDNQYIKVGHYDDVALIHFGEDAAGKGRYRNARGNAIRRALITDMREYNRRIATVYAENNMRNLSAVHKSTQMQIPAFTFVTFAMDGEQLPIVKPGMGDYIDLFPLDYVRAHILGRQYGVIGFWLDQIKTADPERKIARSFFALTMIHELPVWAAWMWQLNEAGMALPNKVWKLKSEFNMRKPTEFFPYWGNKHKPFYRVDSDNVVISLWKQQDRTLAVVTNTGEAGEFNISLDTAKTVNKKDFKITNYENKEVVAENTGNFKLNIPRHDFRILWID